MCLEFFETKADLRTSKEMRTRQLQKEQFLDPKFPSS